MKKYIQLPYVLGLIAIVLVSLTLFTPAVHAACGQPDQGFLGGIACAPKSIGVDDAVTRVINTLLFITGAAAVIVMVVGGLRYVLSGGDPKNTAAAKDTIMYAAIGLVVSLLAYAIVSFVLGQFK